MTVRAFSVNSSVIAIGVIAAIVGGAAWVGSHYRKFDQAAVDNSRRNLTEIVALVRTIEARQAAAIKEIDEIKARQCDVRRD